MHPYVGAFDAPRSLDFRGRSREPQQSSRPQALSQQGLRGDQGRGPRDLSPVEGLSRPQETPAPLRGALVEVSALAPAPALALEPWWHSWDTCVVFITSASLDLM